jgi:hypothetical protein
MGVRRDESPNLKLRFIRVPWRHGLSTGEDPSLIGLIAWSFLDFSELAPVLQKYKSRKINVCIMDTLFCESNNQFITNN